MADEVRSEGDASEDDDLEDEEDPRAVAIDEKCAALVAAVSDLNAGLRGVHSKLDILAECLSRFVRSQQKVSAL